jgi:hypothetical protein
MKPLFVFLAAISLGAPLPAQWLNYPAPGIPRLADGKPNLSAPAPRTADGKPDLSGMWRRTPNLLFYVTSDLKPGDTQPWAEALYKQRADDYRRDSDSITCLPPGPRASVSGTGSPMKIVQTPGLLLILHEYETIYRQIFTDGRQLPVDPNPAFMGYSVGHWDGDTLVVESAGFTDKTWLDLGGHAHSEALHVTERFQRRNFGHIDLEVAVNDPKAYTRPWTVRASLDLTPDTDLLEYVCEERSAPHLVGKRDEEFKVAPEILAKYVGSYDVRPGATWTVSMESGRLMLNRGNGRSPLYALAETTFSEEGTMVEFFKDGQGAVTRLVWRQTEADTVATRRPEPKP